MLAVVPLEQETSIRASIESAEVRMVDFFISKDSFVDLTCNRHYISYDEVSTYKIMFTG